MKLLKTGKRTIAVVLTLIMMVTMLPAKVAGAETTDVELVTVSPIVKIDSPYRIYFSDDNLPTGLYEVTGYTAEQLLQDDFGIGLKKDGTADVVEDGKGYPSALRVLAVVVRSGIIQSKWDTWFPGTTIGDQEYILQAREKANELMKNYLRVEDSQYGKYLTGISEDGENWNPGLVKSGVSPYAPGWTYYVNNKAAETSVDTCAVKENDIVNFSLIPFGDGTGEVYGDLFEHPENALAVAGEDMKLYFYKQGYDADYNIVKSPFANQKVTVKIYDSEGKQSDYETLTTDGEGYLHFKSDNADRYEISTLEEVDDGQGNVYAKTSLFTVTVYFFAKPTKVQSVKTKVTGKKKAKKKTITVSFRMEDERYLKPETFYQVYISTKKKSGYKKAATTVGTKVTSTLKATIKNKKKGTYYVKVRTVYNMPYDYDENGDYKFKALKGDFTSPKKVVVK